MLTPTQQNNPSIIIKYNVICYPLKNAPAGYDFEGGLADVETNELIEQAVIIRHGTLRQVLRKSDEICVNELYEIKDTIFYGGILFDNFGHFLLESISRLWAYSIYKKDNPYILFYCPWGIPDYKKKSNFVYQVLKGFDIPVKRLVFFKNPVKLKTVIIPEQKYGFGICRKPDNDFLGFINLFHFSNKSIIGNRNFEKIYVSRSSLPYKMGRPLGETYFEKYLQENGYLIFHPEKHTAYEQISLYSKAKKIIFCDGGATYCTILIPQLKADVVIVSRRRDSRWNYKEITEHFYGYKKPVLWIDEVIGQYQFGLESWDAVAEIDWYKVSLTLKENGFTVNHFQHSNGEDDKRSQSKEIQEYIQSIQANPLFLNYMLKYKEQYPILPNSF